LRFFLLKKCQKYWFKTKSSLKLFVVLKKFKEKKNHDMKENYVSNYVHIWVSDRGHISYDEKNNLKQIYHQQQCTPFLFARPKCATS
jgi:hypothetical protein